MNALPGLLNADVVACNNIRPNTCTFYQFLGWKAERLPHYYRLGRRRAYYLAKPLRYSLPPVQRDLRGSLAYRQPGSLDIPDIVQNETAHRNDAQVFGRRCIRNDTLPLQPRTAAAEYPRNKSDESVIPGWAFSL